MLAPPTRFGFFLAALSSVPHKSQSYGVMFGGPGVQVAVDDDSELYASMTRQRCYMNT